MWKRRTSKQLERDHNLSNAQRGISEAGRDLETYRAQAETARRAELSELLAAASRRLVASITALQLERERLVREIESAPN